MVPGLQKVDSIAADAIYQPVLLSHAPRPASRQKEFQWLQLADTCKRISQHGFNQFKDTQRDLSIILNPMLEIFPELRLKNSFALSGPRQVPSLV
jgi:hypothetical protein